MHKVESCWERQAFYSVVSLDLTQKDWEYGLKLRLKVHHFPRIFISFWGKCKVLALIFKALYIEYYLPEIRTMMLDIPHKEPKNTFR